MYVMIKTNIEQFCGPVEIIVGNPTSPLALKAKGTPCNLLIVEPSAAVKMDKWCIYIVQCWCYACISDYFLSDGGYIYHINSYGTDIYVHLYVV